MATRKMTKVTTGQTKTENKSNVSSDNEEIKVEETPKKEFEQSDGVLCKSVIQGGLFVTGIKTGMVYQFVDYGDECEIEYRDLVAAVRSKAIEVFAPRFIIEDEDFIAEFPQIQKFYDTRFSKRDLKKILTLDIPEMLKAIEDLPKGAVENLKVIAATQVHNGLLDSVRKIKALDKVFGTELDLISSVFSD